MTSLPETSLVDLETSSPILPGSFSTSKSAQAWPALSKARILSPRSRHLKPIKRSCKPTSNSKRSSRIFRIGSKQMVRQQECRTRLNRTFCDPLSSSLFNTRSSRFIAHSYRNLHEVSRIRDSASDLLLILDLDCSYHLCFLSSPSC